MAKTDIKFMQKLATPRIRKRDGESITHALTIGMTTDEALLLSTYFSQLQNENAPRVSLVRSFLLNQAINAVDEGTLLEVMSAVCLKRRLAYDLSSKDYDRAIDFIKNPPAVKKQEPVPKPVRREYIPEPRRR